MKPCAFMLGGCVMLYSVITRSSYMAEYARSRAEKVYMVRRGPYENTTLHMFITR